MASSALKLCLRTMGFFTLAPMTFFDRLLLLRSGTDKANAKEARFRISRNSFSAAGRRDPN